MACCGLISGRLGKVYMNCQYGAFTNETIKTTMILTKQALPNGYKWAVYMDNATTHVHNNVMAWCEANDVPVCFNAKYRPDLMGIEFFWRLAKIKYRQELTEMYVSGRQVDNLRLVKRILQEIPDDQTKKWAIVGWQHLYNADVIPYIPNINVRPVDLHGDYVEKLIEGGLDNP